jgi:HD superfamily phosphohydrolase
MLHDVGHPPFSHTLEPVFEEAFGLNHHIATERLITGLAPLGNEIAGVLRDFGLDPLAVLHLLNGGDELFDGFFSGPINLDTIEGILRARLYLGMQKLGLSPVKVMKAAASREDMESQRIVDAFWRSKHEVYAFVIRSKAGVFYDGVFQAIARAKIDALEPADFFATEKAIFEKLPLLKEVLDSDRVREIAKRVLPNQIPYQFRHFYIDDATEFRSHDDKERYRQQKTASSLTVRDFLRV